jgi:hypothetical protein
MVDADCGTAVERTCRFCQYVVSSSVLDVNPRANFPTECRQCGGELVPYGGDEDE